VIKTIKYLKLISIVSLFLRDSAFAQACCTAGTPLLGSLEMTSAPKNVLQFGLTFEHNSLTNVLNGSNKFFNDERKRISESALLEVNYGLTNNLSITGLFSYINQVRTIKNIDQSDNTLKASGIGDIVLLTKYSIIGFDIFNREELSIGVGIKFPVGNSSLKSDGILIPADMHPGTGSWDSILWGYYSKSGLFLTDLTLLSSLSYRINGSNNRFDNSISGYSFGNEFIGLIGFNHPLNSFLDFSIAAKYRNTGNDTFGNDDIPNTGGKWVYISPGLSIYMTNKFSTRIDGELPIYRNVSGTQLTTTFTASISLFYSLNLSDGSF